MENLAEHRKVCEVHLYESRSADSENSELIFLYLELSVFIFVLEDCYLRTSFGIRYLLLKLYLMRDFS